MALFPCKLRSQIVLVIKLARKGKPIRTPSRPARPSYLAVVLLLVTTAACSPGAPMPTPTPTIAPTTPPTPSLSPSNPDQLDIRSIVTASGENGMVVGTMAPDAIHSGVSILKAGGSAADAALATALAQVPLLPGNFISYAGIMELLYYDAKSGEIYSMNAGWDIPRAENDPLSIPYTNYPYSGISNPSGRTALVPGFMAGLESAYNRFGTLPFSKLFEPAIAFARQGVVIDDMQASFIAQFEPVITRLTETAALFTRKDGRLYQAGDLFQQPQMAEFLEQVAQNGAAHMYTGEWGEKFVETIQSESGLISMEDMAAYQPIWNEPVSTSYAGYEIYSSGLPGHGGTNLVEAFNLVEAAGLEQYGHFSEDPQSLFWLMQITRSAFLSSFDSLQLAQLYPGQELSLESRSAKQTAAWLWERIQAGALPFFTPMQGAGNTQSAAVVAVDGQGNIAALTHTSNAYLYGGSGITVDGIYIPDPGSYLQHAIQRSGAGTRLPNPINPVIVLRDGQPVWASSCIGNVHQETVQRLVSVLTFGLDLPVAMQAPTILASSLGSGSSPPIGHFFPDSFEPSVIQAVQDLGQPMQELPISFENFSMLQGILSAVSLDSHKGTISGAVLATLGGFAAGY